NVAYPWFLTDTEAALGFTYESTSRYDLAERTYRHAVDVERRLWSREPVSGNRHPLICNSLTLLSRLLFTVRKRYDESESLALEAVRRGEEVVASEPQSLVPAYWLVASANSLGNELKLQGRFSEAEKHYRRAVEVG